MFTEHHHQFLNEKKACNNHRRGQRAGLMLSSSTPRQPPLQAHTPPNNHNSSSSHSRPAQTCKESSLALGATRTLATVKTHRLQIISTNKRTNTYCQPSVADPPPHRFRVQATATTTSTNSSHLTFRTSLRLIQQQQQVVSPFNSRTTYQCHKRSNSSSTVCRAPPWPKSSQQPTNLLTSDKTSNCIKHHSRRRTAPLTQSSKRTTVIETNINPVRKPPITLSTHSSSSISRSSSPSIRRLTV